MATQHSALRTQHSFLSTSSEKVSLRTTYGETLAAMGPKYPELVVMDADIAKSTQTIKFSKAFPKRFYNIGVAEQNMAGIAAGMATVGLKPICSSYAAFISMKSCEQIRTVVCYTNLPVMFVATHGGMATAIDGVTHQATEDLGIFRGFANMKVFSPADATTVKQLIPDAYELDGPRYVRLPRDPWPLVYDKEKGIPDFRIGKGIVLREGSDVGIIATGVMVHKALQAAEKLAGDGIQATVVDIHTIKPFDADLIIEVARRTGALVTYEDHVINNGLGSAVAEVLVENYPVPMERIGLRDVFAESGKTELLFDKYGMNVQHCITAAKRVITRK